MSIKNKVVIITGGASGIGKATASLFLREGAKVVVVDSDADRIKNISAIFKDSNNIIYENIDIRFSDQIKKMVADVIKQFGKIDILFNNAGVEAHNEIQDLPEEEWDFILDTNLKGSFLCSKFVIPHMIKNNFGVIVNNSSKMAELVLEKAGAYCASKSGLLGLTKVMALDLAKYNIRVNAVLPGSVDTPLMWQGVRDEEFEERKYQCERSIPLKRVANPEEIAKFVLFLVSDDASYITGSCLTIDGGLGVQLSTIK